VSALPQLRAEIDEIAAATARLNKAVEDLVAREIARGAAFYRRERDLPMLLGACWGDMTDGEIVAELERKVAAAAKMLAGGYWAGDTNRLIALRSALAAELRE